MQYVMLLAGYGEHPRWDDLGPEAQRVIIDQHNAFSQACRERDDVQILGGESLGEGSTATTLRTPVGGDMVITDGPYAEAAEQIGGFYLMEAPDLDVLIGLCRLLPPYVIDIRPVLDVPE